MGVFRAESSDLSHMGVYTGMGVISVWVLLRANMVLNYSESITICADTEAEEIFVGEQITAGHNM